MWLKKSNTFNQEGVYVFMYTFINILIFSLSLYIMEVFSKSAG